ncbi:MAG: CHAD domain-containing protein [Ignavibacteria bacterium]|nr:CHAD domain-containing protein [Ignavibacteria bacterium]
MTRKYPLDKKESLKKNLSVIIPVMLEDFLALSDIVLNYPLRKNILHEMRKRGKPLRYAMEIGEYCFSKNFKQYLDEIKEVLELMGEIHDADVMIPEINLHIKEIRLFNRTIDDPKQRLSTKHLREIVIYMKNQRRGNYSLLCEKIKYISSENFLENLQNSFNKVKD